jgi:hypothetical protein
MNLKVDVATVRLMSPQTPAASSLSRARKDMPLLASERQPGSVLLKHQSAFLLRWTPLLSEGYHSNSTSACTPWTMPLLGSFRNPI